MNNEKSVYANAQQTLTFVIVDTDAQTFAIYQSTVDLLDEPRGKKKKKERERNRSAKIEQKKI